MNAHIIEDERSTLSCMGEDVQGCVPPGKEPAVEPDLSINLVVVSSSVPIPVHIVHGRDSITPLGSLNEAEG
jgi:hypothetical protein